MDSFFFQISALEAVFQGNGAVEHQAFRSGINIVQTEITISYKLEGKGILVCRRCMNAADCRFHFAVFQNSKTVLVDGIHKILAWAIRIGIVEQIIIHPYLSIKAVIRIHPMNGSSLHFMSVCRIAAAAGRIVFAEDFGDLTLLVFVKAGAGDDVGSLETDLVAGEEALELGDLRLAEVLGFDPEMLGEGDFAAAGLRLDGVVLHGEGLGLSVGIIGHGETDRMKDRHQTLRILVQIVAQAAFEQGPVHGGVHFGNADTLAEIADGTGGVAPSAETAESRHAGIVPAGHGPFGDHLAELALGHDRVVDAEAGKLDLPGPDARYGDIGDHPVIQRTVIFVFQRAERVSDALERVLDGMGKIVHREDAPFGALAMMLDIADPVEDRVAHVEVAAGQVDLRTQGIAAFLELAVAHPLKEIEALFNGPVSPGADSRAGGITAVFAELLRRKLADIGEAFFDQLDGIFIGLLEIIGAIIETVAPVEAEPVDVLLDGVDVFGILLGRVRVVHAQVAQAAELLRGAEVDGQRLAVADMQVAVRLRRETGVDLFPVKAAVFIGKIFFDKSLDKVFVFFHDRTSFC